MAESRNHSVAVQMMIAQLAAMRLLTRNFVFAQGVVIAGRIDVDDIAAAGVFEHGPIAIESVLADRGKLEMTKTFRWHPGGVLTPLSALQVAPARINPIPTTNRIVQSLRLGVTADSFLFQITREIHGIYNMASRRSAIAQSGALAALKPRA